jgi:hypothetical protein
MMVIIFIVVGEGGECEDRAEDEQARDAFHRNVFHRNPKKNESSGGEAQGQTPIARPSEEHS